jgi:hypothetical protein
LEAASFRLHPSNPIAASAEEMRTSVMDVLERRMARFSRHFISNGTLATNDDLTGPAGRGNAPAVLIRGHS